MVYLRPVGLVHSQVRRTCLTDQSVKVLILCGRSVDAPRLWRDLLGRVLGSLNCRSVGAVRGVEVAAECYGPSR